MSSDLLGRSGAARFPADEPTAGDPVGAAQPVPRLGGDRRTRLLSGYVAVLALGMVGLDLELKKSITTATVAAILLLPVWVGQVARQRGLALVSVLGLSAVVGGVALAVANASVSGRSWDRTEAIRAALVILTALGSIGVVLWSRQVLGLGAVAMAYGAGSLAAGVLSASGSANAWKFNLSIPVSIVVLGLCEQRRSPRLAMLALVMLAAVGVLRDSRSYAAFCVLTVVLVLWRSRAQHGRSMRRSTALLLLVATAAVMYQLGTTLLVDGYLGAGLQARTQAQVDNSGSLIAGGRPEWQGTFALAREHPAGFGIAAVPNLGDVAAVKEGMQAGRSYSLNGYIDHFMLGGHIKLHAIVADLWASSGLSGIAFGLAMVVVALRGLTANLVARASPLVVFVVLNALWFLFFGPIYTNLRDVAFAVAVAAPLAVTRRPPT